MAKQINEADFNALYEKRDPMHLPIAEEREWYADNAENILGVIFRDKIDKDWGYAILGRDEELAFRWIEGETSIETIQSARDELLRRLDEVAATGQEIFPQN